MTDTTLDHLSLTLPDWRAAAKKVRRWKPPRPKSWWAAAQVVLLAVYIVVDTWRHDWGGVIFDAVNLACWWRWCWKGWPAFSERERQHAIESGTEIRLPDRLDWLIGGILLVEFFIFALYVVTLPFS